MGRTPEIDLKDFPRNLMSNADCQFWQRGTNFTNPSDGTYTLDRFRVVKSGAMQVNVLRSTAVPSFALAGVIFPYSVQIDVTSASAGAGDYWGLTQFIEGFDIVRANIFGKRLYYSFWARGGAAAGNLAVQFQNNGNEWFMKSVQIIGDNVWRKYQIEIPMVPAAGANWSLTDDRGLWVQHILFAGTTYQAAEPTSWQAAPSKIWPTGGNTLLDAGQSVQMTGFQLDFAPDQNFFLKNLTHDQELVHCQRYYEVTNGRQGLPFENSTSTTIGGAYWSFRVKKRTSPIPVFGSTVAANSRVYHATGLKGVNSLGSGASSPDSMYFIVNMASSGTQFQCGTFAVVAAGADDWIAAEAEL